jgi:hypothetical protein
MLMDVIPLDATLVKGSHGVRPSDPRHYPIIISEDVRLLPGSAIDATDVFGLIKQQVLA